MRETKTGKGSRRETRSSSRAPIIRIAEEERDEIDVSLPTAEDLEVEEIEGMLGGEMAELRVRGSEELLGRVYLAEGQTARLLDKWINRQEVLVKQL